MKSYRRDIVLVFRGTFANQANLPSPSRALSSAFSFVGFQSISVTLGMVVKFVLLGIITIGIAVVWVLPAVLPHYDVDYPVLIPTEWYVGLFWKKNGSPGWITVTVLAFILP